MNYGAAFVKEDAADKPFNKSVPLTFCKRQGDALAQNNYAILLEDEGVALRLPVAANERPVGAGCKGAGLACSPNGMWKKASR